MGINSKEIPKGGKLNVWCITMLDAAELRQLAIHAVRPAHPLTDQRIRPTLMRAHCDTHPRPLGADGSAHPALAPRLARKRERILLDRHEVELVVLIIPRAHPP